MPNCGKERKKSQGASGPLHRDLMGRPPVGQGRLNASFELAGSDIIERQLGIATKD